MAGLWLVDYAAAPGLWSFAGFSGPFATARAAGASWLLTGRALERQCNKKQIPRLSPESFALELLQR